MVPATLIARFQPNQPLPPPPATLIQQLTRNNRLSQNSVPATLLTLVLLLTLPASAHIVSMSTADATLTGARLDYELRMPLYEVAHVTDPARTLLQNIHFYGGGDEARLVTQSCDTQSDQLVCKAMYLFPRDVEEFSVRCTFPAVTVPNHVHLLRVSNGQRNDQAAFDISFTEATLRFRDPTAFETLFRSTAAGFWRAIAGPAQLLFLFALLLAARDHRDLAILFSTFALGQIAAAILMRITSTALAPRFIEAAAGLTIAYLAVELLVIPNAGGRSVVTGILGLFHGVYFSMMFAAGDYRPALFLSGALVAEAAVAAILWIGVRRLHTRAVRTVLSSLLLATGLGWFALRLNG